MRLLLVSFFALWGWGCQPTSDSSEGQAASLGALDLEQKRKWAASLRADGLDDQALAVYEDILTHESNLSEKLASGLAINVAEIHFQNARFAEALAALHRAKLFTLTDQRRRKIDTMSLTCLERLGRTKAADRLLDRLSSRDSKPADANDVVLAEVGDEKIRRSEFESLMASTNLGSARKDDGGPTQLEILQSLVSQRVLARKARKAGLETDGEVQLAIDLAIQDVLVRKFVAERLKEEKPVTEDDARLFFEAKRALFRSPGSLEVAHIVVDDEAAVQSVRARLSAGENFAKLAGELSRDDATSSQGGRVAERVIEGRSHPIFSRPQDLFRVVGGTPAGSVAPESLRTAKGLHVVQVMGRTEGKPYSYDEVKEQAAQLLRRDREQQAMKRIMGEALNEADVVIHEEHLK